MVRYARSRLVMVNHVRIMHLRVTHVREMHVWAEISRQGIIEQGT
jgi:hypothetical protein